MGCEWIYFGTTLHLITATLQLSILILAKPDVELDIILLDRLATSRPYEFQGRRTFRKVYSL